MYTVFEIRYFFVKPIVKIFQKSVKNRKNQQKCENENSRETTKLVIIISNREHTLDVISKAFIFLVMLAKVGIQGPSRDWIVSRQKKFDFCGNSWKFLFIYRYVFEIFVTWRALKLWYNWWKLNSIEHLIPNIFVHYKIHIRNWCQITQKGFQFEFSQSGVGIWLIQKPALNRPILEVQFHSILNSRLNMGFIGFLDQTGYFRD